MIPGVGQRASGGTVLVESVRRSVVLGYLTARHDAEIIVHPQDVTIAATDPM
jgi:hypothetical protein